MHLFLCQSQKSVPGGISHLNAVDTFMRNS